MNIALDRRGLWNHIRTLGISPPHLLPIRTLGMT